MNEHRTPSLATGAVRRLAPSSLAPEILDELAREHGRRARAGGLLRADAWYWRQVFSFDWFRLRRELSSSPPRVQATRRRRWEVPMSAILSDLRYAVRSLVKSPGFTAIVVLTLALGIGASVALTSVVRAVVLAPLPYGEPERVVSIWSQWAGFPKTWLSIGEYRVYRDTFETFDDVALYGQSSVNLTGESEPERVGLAEVSPNLFEVLRASFTLGRSFTVAEAQPETSEVVVLAHGLWQRRYGGDPGLLGRRIGVDGLPRTVIGVLPAEFRLPIDFASSLPIDVYLPMYVPPGVTEVARLGGSHSYFGVARLAGGASLDLARTEALAWNRQAVVDGIYPDERRFRTLVLPVADDVIGDVRGALGVLLAAVGFVLLIACVNVANLVLTRAHARQRETALRTALGAGFGRVVRQLFAESFVLALSGGALAVLLAWSTLEVFVALDPGTVPRLENARLDGPLLALTALLSAVVALAFGVLPAIAGSRIRVAGGLFDGVRGASPDRSSQRFRAVLAGAQLAVTVVLVMAAGLMIRTFAHLTAIDPGFRSENVLTLRLAIPERDYPESGDVIAFYDRLLEEVRGLPGVEAAGAIRNLPLSAQIGDWGTRIEGHQPAENESTAADWQVATAGYFEAMGMKLLAGRTFTPADRAEGEPVVIVNESFAQRYWPNASALGQRIQMGGVDDPPWNRIVGVVGDVRHNGITAEIKEKWYRPHGQFHQSSGFTPSAMTLVVRTSVPAQSLAGPVRDTIHELDAALPVAEVRTLEEVVGSSLAQPRFTTALLVVLSALALVIASVGVYGVIAYAVGQRRYEFGVRLALGASPRGVVALVLRQGLVMGAVGAAVGGAAAAVVTGYMDSVLYGVDARDPATFAAVLAVLVAAATLGSLVPALRAARVDPVEALNSE